MKRKPNINLGTSVDYKRPLCRLSRMNDLGWQIATRSRDGSSPCSTGAAQRPSKQALVDRDFRPRQSHATYGHLRSFRGGGLTYSRRNQTTRSQGATLMDQSHKLQQGPPGTCEGCISSSGQDDCRAGGDTRGAGARAGDSSSQGPNWCLVTMKFEGDVRATNQML
jgi:hypothetical protein